MDSNKRVCFVGNYNKTKFYVALAASLAKRGYDCYFICCGSNAMQYFNKNNPLASKTLDLSKYSALWQKKDEFDQMWLDELQKSELTFEVKLCDMIMMDRLLRRRKVDYALRYLSVAYRVISKFFDENQIDIVFQESTWAHEILTSQICYAQNIQQYCPHVARIEDYFLFFKGYKQQDYFRFKVTEEEVTQARENAIAYLKQFQEKQMKPEYFHRNPSKAYLFKLEYIGKFIKHAAKYYQDRKDESAFPFYHTSKTKLLQWFRAKHYKKLAVENIKTEIPYAFYPLHVQPEASIDVMGAYCSNQVEMIKSIRRLLPSSITLYVKEHPNLIGSKSKLFYNEIIKIPGVILVSAYYDSHKLLKESALNFSITGTSALESGLFGRKTVCFQKMFFDSVVDCSGVSFVNAVDQKRMYDLLLLSESTVPEDARVKFLTDIFLHGGQGDVSINGHMANIEKVIPKFIKLIEECS